MTVAEGNTLPSVSRKLLDLITDHELHQMQQQPTYQGALLDLFITNRPGLVSHSANMPGISTVNEHDALVYDMEEKASVAKKNPKKDNAVGKGELVTTQTANSGICRAVC